MKRIIIIGAVVAVLALLVLAVAKCGGKCKCDNHNNCGDSCKCGCVDSTKIKPKPMNVTVFIDLSDRIAKDRDGMKQVDKDLEIINGITEFFVDKQWGRNGIKGNIKYTKDRIKVLFYPAPNDPNVSNLAKGLDYDFGNYTKAQMQQKMDDATNLSKNFNGALKQIYEGAIRDHNFIGSDIWGFFDTKVNNLCVDSKYRNILIILTDGYVLDINHKENNSSGANYITQSTLAQGLPLLPVKSKVNGNLEVLVLEVNANPVGDFNKIEKTLGDWFAAMGVNQYQILETDLPNTSKLVIRKFLDKY